MEEIKEEIIEFPEQDTFNEDTSILEGVEDDGIQDENN